MLKLYNVIYRKNSGTETASVAVVATTPLKALDGAKFVMRQRYAADREILSLTKIQDIDRVEK